MKGNAQPAADRGGWKINSTRKVFENPFFAVFEDDVIKPNGEEGEYATIDFCTGVSVLPIDDDGYVYLTRQFRYAIGREDIEVLAGSISGESALEAAKRETKEELGIKAEEWVDLGNVQSITSIARSNSRQFIARGLSFGEAENEGTEDIEQFKVKLDEAFEMVMSGEITDADTCILIMKAAALNEKKAAG